MWQPAWLLMVQRVYKDKQLSRAYTSDELQSNIPSLIGFLLMLLGIMGFLTWIVGLIVILVYTPVGRYAWSSVPFFVGWNILWVFLFFYATEDLSYDGIDDDITAGSLCPICHETNCNTGPPVKVGRR